MGLLDRMRGTTPEEPWHPRVTGACACADHRATIADLVIDSHPPVVVKDLAPEALVVSIVPTPEHFIEIDNWRRGPYQWHLTYGPPLSAAYDADAPATIDDLFFIQSGIDNLLRLDASTLAVGAAEMCADGIATAFLVALSNPRARRA